MIKDTITNQGKKPQNDHMEYIELPISSITLSITSILIFNYGSNLHHLDFLKIYRFRKLRIFWYLLQ